MKKKSKNILVQLGEMMMVQQKGKHNPYICGSVLSWRRRSLQLTIAYIATVMLTVGLLLHGNLHNDTVLTVVCMLVITLAVSTIPVFLAIEYLGNRKLGRPAIEAGEEWRELWRSHAREIREFVKYVSQQQDSFGEETASIKACAASILLTLGRQLLTAEENGISVKTCRSRFVNMYHTLTSMGVDVGKLGDYTKKK